MLKKILYILIILFMAGVNTVSHAMPASWSFPENYGALLEKVIDGDYQAQEEICTLIYKRVLPFPQDESTKDRHLFGWLNEVHPHQSFQRKIARFFFKRGYIEDAKKIFEEIQERAHRDDIYAQRFMGSCYFYTDDLRGDGRNAALDWYRKAAHNGHARAQLSLAIRYMEEVHVPQDYPRRFKMVADGF